MSTDGQNPPPTVERGTYEIIRDRLIERGRVLGERAESLNTKRLELFGSTELAVIGSERIRTENNCVPRDIVSVGDRLLFGFNVFIGLKTETSVDAVFSLHELARTGEGFAFNPIALDAGDAFLSDPQFVKEFRELYQYYKETRLLHLRRPQGKLLAVFQTGASIADVKVFRWSVDVQGRVTYIDNRGERDNVFPPSHDFEWTPTLRENFVLGRHPHISILDEVFIDTVGGDLTIKIENNTEDGLGIYREAVEERDQALEDAQVSYAKLGGLILLKVLPYREKATRYLVFNTRTRKVDRIDAIGQACVRLPEDHGLIFPGGYYLQSGETKVFDANVEGMEFESMVRSPNGEDVLYTFHRRTDGLSVLLTYNMIRKQVQTPIACHGFCIFDDGKIVVFRAQEEATRVHTMQIWQTPFMSDAVAAAAPSTGSYLEKVGNAELVRGISDCLSIRRAIEDQRPSTRIYEDLIKSVAHMLDQYHWLANPEVGDLASPLGEIRSTAELIIDEFEKVESLRKQAIDAVDAAEHTLKELTRDLDSDDWESLDLFVGAMAKLRSHRGQIITLRDVRYVDRARLDALEAQTVGHYDALGARTVDFLLGETALQPYIDRIAALEASVAKLERVSECPPIADELDRTGTELELLTDVVGNLKIDDATLRTRILEGISEVLGTLNRARALLLNCRKEMLSREGVAEFGARFKLFGQNVASALALADTPEKCEEQLSKTMLALEDLEGRFSEFDEFLAQLATKREEVYEAFSSKRQALLDERHRRADHTMEAALRILQGVARRAATFATDDELNAYFASDAMVMKLRELSERLREIGDAVRADEVESKLKSARSDAARGLRDRRDIFEEGASVIRLGRHRFSVNTQPIELTLIPREGQMWVHLGGTDFYQQLADPEFDATRPYWEQTIVSESPDVYRAEYLAACMLADAEELKSGLSIPDLVKASLDRATLVELVRSYAQARYDEGYERGIHDADTAAILEKLVGLYQTADLLRFAPAVRAAACLFWGLLDDAERRDRWVRRARSFSRLRKAFQHSSAIVELVGELSAAIAAFHADNRLTLHADDARMAGQYLFEEIAETTAAFVTSAEAEALRADLVAHLDAAGAYREFVEDLRVLGTDLTSCHRIVRAWLEGFVTSVESARAYAPAIDEAVALVIVERRLDRTVSSALGAVDVDGLLGQHPRIKAGRLNLRLDEFLSRLGAFRHVRVPGFRDYQAKRSAVLERERKRLRLSEFQPNVMNSFVRNRLINEVYLPVIGDNLAKQIGALGEGKRTDLMGMLLLISPPGYGKTTLMEYVANRLGIVFVKVNGPALGHGVVSLDPAEAPNATARQEVQKINLALEMGNNVLLYLDDIQHTNPELLQKFITLCDAQRKIEGVWNGETKTYDFRGKRFYVCMAGNPYTESGEQFKIPDMLANRADTYNLGEILEGKDDLFALSYIENALTSNAVLAPLTTRGQDDIDKLVRMAKGEEIQLDQLSHEYSAVELGEIRSVLQKLVRIQEVLLKVNKQYILSASQTEAYRTEPPFKLQGSYRNMNKLTEKVVPVMNDAELESLIDDHYLGESQTLTTGAEHNLLKLAELRGKMTPEQAARWDEIKRSFGRVQVSGGADADPVTRLTGHLSMLTERVEGVGTVIAKSFADAAQNAPEVAPPPDYGPVLDRVDRAIEALAAAGSRNEDASPAGERAVVVLAQQFAAIAQRLDRLNEAIRTLGTEAAAAGASTASAVPAALPAQAADITAYLGKLDETLAAMAAAPRGGEIVQVLPPGMNELIGRMIGTIEESLIPVTRQIGQELEASKPATDPKMTYLLDKALKNFDLLRDLFDALKKIDTSALVAPKRSPRRPPAKG
jgi:MoxR-like ATPase